MKRGGLIVLVSVAAFVAGALYRPSAVRAVDDGFVGRYQIVTGRIPANAGDGSAVGDYAATFLVDSKTGRVWWAIEYSTGPIFVPAAVGEPTASTKLVLAPSYSFGSAPKE